MQPAAAGSEAEEAVAEAAAGAALHVSYCSRFASPQLDTTAAALVAPEEPSPGSTSEPGGRNARWRDVGRHGVRQAGFRVSGTVGGLVGGAALSE